MLENKPNKDANNSPNACNDKEVDENSEFVELDPIGRYGRYENVLGKGAFKTVYRAFDEVDGIEVAWNQVKVEDVLQSPEDLERLYSEVHLLKTLKHKNIIKFYNSWIDMKTKNVNFITEIFTSGTLRQYRKRHKHVDIKAVKNWSRQILRGLLYLHSHDPPIIHRDLKCDNIFVNGNNGEVKIGDLGLAAILRQAHAAHSVIGTPEFMAPELYEEEYNELVDIYSFGMCLLEMVTFEYPYSECTNAAQIYKKVTAGKKPAALDKVKDPEVRAFIEKCLAIASRRLPARELLMDPFLQCEGDRETIDTMSNLSHLKMGTINSKELDIEEKILTTNQKEKLIQKMVQQEEKNIKLQCDERLSKNRSLNAIRKGVLNGKNESQEDDVQTHQHFLNDKYSKRDQPKRSVDFRVKGKRRDDDTINLRLRIANLKGQIRNIHFPFDIEADTAMSVATEMLAELDFSDQDVTTIAEMIDAEILALVPEWKTGVAVDEIGTEGEIGEEENSVSMPHEDLGVLATMSSDQGSIVDQHISNWKGQSHSPNVLAMVSSPPRIEGTMHGRFEEVTYDSHIEHSRQGSHVPLVFSSDSLEAREDGRDFRGGHSTPKSTVSVADSESPPCEAFDFGNELTYPGGNCTNGIAFNKLVELRRKAGIAKFSHDVWEGMTESSQRFEQSEHARSHGEDIIEGTNERVTQELELLTLRQKQELKELQWRHEQALCALKNRQHYRTIQGDYKLQRRSISLNEQHSASSIEGFHHNHSLDLQILPSYDYKMMHNVDKNNKKLALDVEDAQKLSPLSSLDSTGFNSNIRFVAAPKAFGLGHNLQGHILIEPYEGRRPHLMANATPIEVSKETKNRDQIYESIVLNSSVGSQKQDCTQNLAPS